MHIAEIIIKNTNFMIRYSRSCCKAFVSVVSGRLKFGISYSAIFSRKIVKSLSFATMIIRKSENDIAHTCEMMDRSPINFPPTSKLKTIKKLSISIIFKHFLSDEWMEGKNVLRSKLFPSKITGKSCPTHASLSEESGIQGRCCLHAWQ